MGDHFEAIERAGLVPRSIRPAPAVVPAFVVARRSAALVKTIGRMIIEASLRESSPIEFADRAQRTARAILKSHGVEVRRIGNAAGGPSLIVSNHVSYLDALVVASLIPCIAIAKAETAQWPLFGAGLRALGVLFVVRDDVASGAVALRNALRALGRGASVLNFPEGTTTNGSEIGMFRRGSFGLARLAGVPIVPVRITYDDDRVPWFGGQEFGPHYLRLARSPGVVARAHFGEPMVVSGADDPADLAARARGIVSALSAC
jgi:1-acyl-sn-glycerol-3-phosphate acyltransferase